MITINNTVNYGYQLFFNNDSKNEILDCLKKYEHKYLTTNTSSLNFIQFGTATLMDLPNEDDKFTYKIFDFLEKRILKDVNQSTYLKLNGESFDENFDSDTVHKRKYNYLLFFNPTLEETIMNIIKPFDDLFIIQYYECGLYHIDVYTDTLLELPEEKQIIFNYILFDNLKGELMPLNIPTEVDL